MHQNRTEILSETRWVVFTALPHTAGQTDVIWTENLSLNFFFVALLYFLPGP